MLHATELHAFNRAYPPSHQHFPYSLHTPSNHFVLTFSTCWKELSHHCRQVCPLTNCGKSNRSCTGPCIQLETFVTYGISDKLSSDGAPEFTPSMLESFFHTWGVWHRISSVAYPHSNCQAEIGVKTVKQLIIDNTGRDGDLNTDTFQRAILQYRNTPDHDTGLSPADCLFGRPIRDFIPIHLGKYLPHKTWQKL